MFGHAPGECNHAGALFITQFSMTHVWHEVKKKIIQPSGCAKNIGDVIRTSATSWHYLSSADSRLFQVVFVVFARSFVGPYDAKSMAEKNKKACFAVAESEPTPHPLRDVNLRGNPLRDVINFFAYSYA